ncbi:MAG: glycerophosphodiester phosphodiesterase family protein, partial [Verrucomicrobiota bacterium]
EMDWVELANLDVGAWTGSRWEGERIPLLREVMASVPEGKRIYVDLKVKGTVCESLSSEIDDAGIDFNQLVVMSFDRDVIRSLEEMRTEIYTALLVPLKRSRFSRRWSDAAAICRELEEIGADAVCFSWDDRVDQSFVSKIERRGFECHAWRVNTLSILSKAKRSGIRSVITDFPKEFVEDLAEAVD